MGAGGGRLQQLQVCAPAHDRSVRPLTDPTAQVVERVTLKRLCPTVVTLLKAFPKTLELQEPTFKDVVVVYRWVVEGQGGCGVCIGRRSMMQVVLSSAGASTRIRPTSRHHAPRPPPQARQPQAQARQQGGQEPRRAHRVHPEQQEHHHEGGQRRALWGLLHLGSCHCGAATREPQTWAPHPSPKHPLSAVCPPAPTQGVRRDPHGGRRDHLPLKAHLHKALPAGQPAGHRRHRARDRRAHAAAGEGGGARCARGRLSRARRARRTCLAPCLRLPSPTAPHPILTPAPAPTAPQQRPARTST
jgi:hypothetical protein